MKHLTKKQMWIFAIGQLGWSLLGGIITTWLVTLYLPTRNDIELGAIQYLTPGLVVFGVLTLLGLITFICRIFDAVTDPLVASLSDRCKAKRGRRIPFMLYSAVPFAVMTIVVFLAPVGKSSPWNFVWVLIALVVFYACMTLYCTPYNALISEFGKTQQERMFISTSISLTYFAGTLLAYVPFAVAPMLMGAVGFAWAYRICFIVLAVVALVCMLTPALLLKEREFVNNPPSKSNAFKSLKSTFKNKDFRVFVGSDLMYWIGLTLFQTGLPFFIKVMTADATGKTVLYYMGAMTVLSACFYPLVSKLVKKFGKKKLVIAGFFGLALAYLCTAFIGSFGKLAVDPLTIAVVIIAAFPMALLGIIPQSIVADIAEEEAVVTGENREGMFFASRTFAMKLGQSIAMLAFTSLAILSIGSSGSNTSAMKKEYGGYSYVIEVGGNKTEMFLNPDSVTSDTGKNIEFMITSVKLEKGDVVNVYEIQVATSTETLVDIDYRILEEGKLTKEDTYTIPSSGAYDFYYVVNSAEHPEKEQTLMIIPSTDIMPTQFGMRVVAIVAVVFCVSGAIILMFYNEKKVLKAIAKEEDKEFLAAVEGKKEESSKEEDK